MAVKMRLTRMGKKKKPQYRIVVADSRNARDGKVIDEVGTYDPSKEPSGFKIDEEKAKQEKYRQMMEQVESRLNSLG